MDTGNLLRPNLDFGISNYTAVRCDGAESAGRGVPYLFGYHLELLKKEKSI